MVSIKQRRVNPVPSGHRSFNELHDASTLLDKKQAVPAADRLKRSQSRAKGKPQRTGQLIDILV